MCSKVVSLIDVGPEKRGTVAKARKVEGGEAARKWCVVWRDAVVVNGVEVTLCMLRHGVRGVGEQWRAHAALVAKDHDAKKRVRWYCMVVVNAHACVEEKAEVGRLDGVLFIVCVAHKNGANRRALRLNLHFNAPQAA